MAAKMKWDLSGKGIKPVSRDEMMGGYSGPDLPKGSWPAKIKRMTVHEIQSAANKGKRRISVLLEVQTAGMDDKAQYHGAPVWDNLNIIDGPSLGFVNGFLHALTDGSESAKRAIESAFWDEDKGPLFKKVQNKKGVEETHIIKIGRVPISSPGGDVMVQITTRPGQDNNGNYRPEVTGYIPHANSLAPQDDSDDVDDIDDDDDDLLDDDDDGDDVDDDDDGYGDEDEEDDDAEPVAAARGRKPF